MSHYKCTTSLATPRSWTKRSYLIPTIQLLFAYFINKKVYFYLLVVYIMISIVRFIFATPTNIDNANTQNTFAHFWFYTSNLAENLATMYGFIKTIKIYNSRRQSTIKWFSEYILSYSSNLKDNNKTFFPLTAWNIKG